jgi:UTP:GlnB (protein PII) uridylyltransferase
LSKYALKIDQDFFLNQIALDIFNVKPPPEQLFEDERWERAGKNLQSALSGDLDLVKALGEKMAAYRSFKTLGLIRPHRIVIDNDSSSFFTIVEVFTYDFPGLLFTITDALFRCKLDIWVAKIATKVDQVVDVFYVRDFEPGCSNKGSHRKATPGRGFKTTGKRNILVNPGTWIEMIMLSSA